MDVPSSRMVSVNTVIHRGFCIPVTSDFYQQPGDRSRGRHNPQGSSHMEHEAAVFLPLSKVNVIEGFNPRRYFDPHALDELAESIRSEGVIQPIVVRPLGGDAYAVIAGERRWRAARIAGLNDIPAVVRDVDEARALVIAGIENMKRDNMGPAEEAELARRVLGNCDGDRKEAMSLLGWTQKKFETRLLLLHASPKVIEALIQRRILLGHAELLSTLPEATQDGTLEQIIEKNITVSDLRDKVAAFALDLSTACFDTAACMRCAHNTTRQASLFEQSVGEGRCTNKVCFSDKSKAAVEAKRVALQDQYNAVWLDIEKAPGTWRIVLKNAVGATQFNEGCKGCKNFGALLSTAPGTNGALTEDVCGHVECYKQKNEAHVAPKEKTVAPPVKKQPVAGAAAPAPATKEPKPAAVTQDNPKKVQEYVAALHRKIAAAELPKSPTMVKVYSVLALLEVIGVSGSSDNDPLAAHNIPRPAYAGRTARTELIETLHSLDDGVLDPLLDDLCARIALGQGRTSTDDVYLDGARETVRVLQTSLAKHFTMNKEFLDAHTKSGIEALMNESGFTAYYNGLKNDKNASGALCAKKKDELITAVLGSGFDYAGFVPASCRLPTRKS